MPRTEEGERLARQHLRDQHALRRTLLADFSDLFPGWSLNDPGSFDDVARAGAVLARRGHQDSAGVAADFYERFRQAEGFNGMTPRLAERREEAAVRELIRSNGLAGTVNARRRGEPMQAAMRNGLVRASGVVAAEALNGGRETVKQTAQEDSEAVGVSRITGGDPCAFCAMLASRGPVYKTEEAARGSFMPPDSEEFKVHSHCQCQYVQHYEGAQLPGDSSELRDQWNESQERARRDGDLQRGTKNDQLNAFRRHLGKT